MEDTLTNLARQNELLRSQLEVFRNRFHSHSVIRSAVQGGRPGDRYLCSRESYQSVVVSMIDPVTTCVEVCCGQSPQTWVSCPVHILIEPDSHLAERFTARFPEKVVLAVSPAEFFSSGPSRSVDSIVLRGDLSEAGQKQFQKLRREACRVARGQVIVSYTQGRWRGPSNDPLQLNGAAPMSPGREGPDILDVSCLQEFSDDILVVSLSSDMGGSGVDEFTIIVNVNVPPERSVDEQRVVIISEFQPRFVFRADDLVICDVDIAAVHFTSGELPVRNMIVVPLKLLRPVLTLPFEVLRSTVINFAFLENYIRYFRKIEAMGVDAEVALAEIRARQRSAVFGGEALTPSKS